MAIYELEERVYLDAAAVADVLEATEIMDAEQQAAEDAENIENSADDSSFDTDSVGDADGVDTDEISDYSDLVDDIVIDGFDLNVDTVQASDIDDAYDFILGDEHADSLSADVDSHDNEIYIIDSAIDDAGDIIDAIPDDATVVHLAEGEGVSKITEIVNENSDIDSVHIVSQGNYAQIILGDDVITKDNILEFQDDFSSWQDNLSSDADILFYGCDIAKEAQGQEVLGHIADWTGADIAASSDITGGELTSQDSAFVTTGDWNLEYSTGTIEADVLHVDNYNHHLESYTVTDITDDGDIADEGSLSWAIAQSNSTTSVDDTITFSLDSGDTVTVSGILTVSDDVTIEGNGCVVAFEGDGSGFVFDDANSDIQISITVKDINIVDAYGSTSADTEESVNLIRNSENLTIVNTNIDDIGYVYAHVPSITDTPKVLLVSSILNDVDDLVAAAKSDVIVLEYDPQSTTMDQLSTMVENALAGRKASSVAFATHDYGENKFYLTDSETISLGSTLADSDQREFWQEIGGMVQEGGRIDLLACSLASGDNGGILIGALESVAGVNVAASTDITGNVENGGNWILETDNIDCSVEYFQSKALKFYTEQLDADQEKVYPTEDSAAYCKFGYSVSLSDDGSIALVGAYGYMSNTGNAYIYNLGEETWSQAAVLTASDGALYDNFGCSVSLSGDGTTALIGAKGDDDQGGGSGSAYIFTTSDSWSTNIQAAKLTASDGSSGDGFGSSVSLSADGTTALIGAYLDDDLGDCSGSAYVFTTSDSWSTNSQAAKLTASDGYSNDYFGYSVSLSGDGTTALIGAQYDDDLGDSSGSAYIFTTSDSWSTNIQAAKLTASDGASNDCFGNSVSLSDDGTTALIGAFEKSYYSGSAYIFTTSDAWSTPTQAAKLTASDGASFDHFGSSVSLSADGTTALIGAQGDDSYSGSAYIFTTSDSWSTNSQAAKLTASDGASVDYFGYSVSLSGDGTTALIGAQYDDDLGTDSGSAYIFTTSDSWFTNTQIEKFYPDVTFVNENFGYSVSLSDDGTTALIGAYGYASKTGNAYVYILTAESWSQAAVLTASDGVSSDYFGYSVSLSDDGTTALIGAQWDDALGRDSGSAYIFTTSDSWSTYTQAAKLTASDGYRSDSFGCSVSLSDDGATALIGAFQDDVSSGSAYIFTTSDSWSTYTQAAKLTASDAATSDQFGKYLSLSGDGATALIGAYLDDDLGSDSGSAYIFTTSDSWSTNTQAAKLIASDGASSDYFGCSVSLSLDGTTALIGAYRDDAPRYDSGSAYIFTTSDSWSTYTQNAKLTASDGTSFDHFGCSVSLSVDGATALIGADGDDGKGSAYIFTTSNAWSTNSQTWKLTASDGADNDNFGKSVSLSNDAYIAGYYTALIGAYGDDTLGSSAGSAYFYEITDPEYYYRTDSDGGQWNGADTWLRSTTGEEGSFESTDEAPTVDNSLSITITDGAVVLVTSNTEIDDMTIADGGTLTLTSGTFTVSDGDVDLTVNGTLDMDGGLLELAAGAELVYGTSSTLVYSGTSTQTTADEFISGEVKNLEIDNSAGVNLSSSSTISGNLALTSGIFITDSNDFTTDGNVEGAGTLSIGTGTVDVDGEYNVTGNTTFTGAGNLKLGGTVTSFGTLTDTMGTVTYDGNSAQSLLEDTYYNLTINKTNTTDTVTLTSGTANVGGDLTITNGILNASSNEINVTGSTTGAGELEIGTGTVDVDGTYNVTGITDFTGAGNLKLGGTVTSFGTLTDTMGTVTYDGNSAQSLLEDTYYNLTINKTNTTDTVTLASGTADVNGNLTISKGVFSTANLDVEGTTSFSSADGNSALVITGTDVSFGTLAAGSGTVTYDRAGAQDIASGTYYNVAFSGGGIKTLLGVLDVGNDFTINSDSVVDSGDFDITVGGDWINNAGTAGFTAGSGTVTFDGSGDSQILGSTNFNNFSCTTAGKGIIFDTAGIQTIGGTFTLTGTEDLITVSSTNAGDQAVINVADSFVSYVEVVDSNNTGTLIQTTKSEDLGNNNGWQFALYYKTIDTGGALIWSIESDWLVSDDLLSWSEAEAAPDADNALTIQIQSNANVSVTSDVTADQVVVDSGGTLTLTGGVFTVADGDGTDLTANGDISVVGSGTLLINSGAAVDSNGLFSSDGTVSFADDGQLSLAAENATLGTLVAGSGTVIYDREGLQTIYGAEYNNLTVSGSGVKSIFDDITIAGTDLIDGSAQIGLFITGCSIETKTYNGTDTATVIYDSITSNNAFRSYTDFSIEAGSALFDSPDAGVGKNVWVGAFSTIGADASKYVINNYDFFTVGNIDQRVLGVGGSFTTAASKVYDADATIAADTSGVTFSNVVGSDDVSSSVGVGTFDSGSNAVTDGTVNLTSLTLTGTSSGNYTYSDLSGVAAATASITRKSVDLTGERAYDGTAVLNAGIFTISGEVGSETLTLTGAGIMADKNVGEDKAVSSLGTLTLGDGTNGGLASNYTLSGGTDVVTVTEKSVTLTGSFTVADKTYNGSTETLILTSSLGLDGVETGDTVNISTETAAFDTANAGTGKTVDVTVSISGADSGNYTVSYTGAPTAEATVYQKSVDISGSRTYDGTAVADSTDLEVTGEVSGEELGLSGSGLMFSKNVGVDKTVYNQNLTLVDGDGGLASNYTLSRAVMTLTVTRADVTFSTSDVSKTYDGTTDADGTVTVVSGEIFNGDTASGGTFAYGNANVSTGKTVTVSGVTVDDGNGGSNYSVSYEDNTSSEITAAVISLSGTQTYNGTTSVASGSLVMSGLVGSETLTLSGSGVMTDKNVGTGKSFTSGTLALGDGTNDGLASNYTLTGGTDTVDITTASISITSSDVSKTYDGDTTADGTAELASGSLYGSDYLSGGTFTFDSSNVGTGMTVAVSGVTVNDDNSGSNYSVTYVDNTSSEITAAVISLSGTRTYNGTVYVSSGDLEMSGLVGDETLTLTGTGSMADKNVGIGKTFSLGTLVLGDGDNGGYASNYTLTGGTDTVDITTASISITSSDVSKTYDGDTTADGTAELASGSLYGTDSISGGTFTFDSSNVGTGMTVAVSGVTVNDDNSGSNYSVTYVDNTSSEITAAVISLSGSREYNGETTVDAGILALSGLVGDETLTLTGTGLMADKNIGEGKSFTSGTLALGDGTNDGLASNYTLTGGTDTVDITAKALTFSGSFTAAGKVYDGSNETVILTNSISLVGGVAGDDVSVNGYYAEFADKNAGTGKSVVLDQDLMSLSGTDSGNYSLSFSGAPTTTATIAQRSLDISASRTYDGTSTLESDTFVIDSGLVGDETLVFSGSALMYNKDAGTDKYVYLDSLVLEDGTNDGLAANYTLDEGEHTADISKATISITTSDVSKTYDGETTADGTAVLASGSLYGSDYLSGGTFTFENKNVGTDKTVTVSGVTINDGNSGNNYTMSGYVDNTSSEILAKDVTVSGTRSYDGTADFESTILSMSGLVSGESLSLTGTGTVSSIHVSEGAQTIDVTGLTLGDSGSSLASNYELVSGGTGTITAVELTVDLTNTGITKVYDSTSDAPTGFSPSYSLSGFVSGDTDAAISNNGISYNSANVAEADTLTVSGLSISSISGSLGSAATDYSLDTATLSKDASITARDVTVSGTRSYDGTADFESTILSMSGLVSGESLSLTGTGTVSSIHVSEGAQTIDVTGLTLGDSGSFLASNYELVSGGTGTITAVELTVDLTNTGITKVYDGTSDAPTGFSPSYSLIGFVSGDTDASISNSGISYNSANVAEADTLTVSGLSISSVSGSLGSAATDYSLDTATLSKDASITARDVRVSGTRSYDGTADFGSTILSMSGLVSGESLSLTGTGTVSSIHVSEGAQTIDVTGLTLGDSGSSLASNYELVSGGTGTITAVELTVDLTNTGITKVYNGTSDAPTGFSPSYSLSGFVSGDTDASISNSGISYNSANVAEADTLTVSGLSISSVSGSLGSAATDYSLDTATLSKDASITARDVRVSGTRSYDGTADFESTILSMSGLVSGESLSLTGTGTVSSIHVSEGAQTIDVTGLTLGDSGSFLASNYELVSGGTGTITAVELTVDLTNTGITKVYDSTSDAPTGFSPSYSLSGFVSGDTDASISNSGISYNSANVAEADTLTVSGLSISSISGSLGSAATDYSLDTATLSKDASITARDVTVSGTRSYDGTADFESTILSMSGLVSGESLSLTGTGTVSSIHVSEGAQTIDVTGLTLGDSGSFLASNYELVSGGKGTITAVELTVDLTNTGITKVYDGTSDAPTGFSPSYSLIGFVSGDTDASISNSGISYNSANVAEADTLTVSGLSISSVSGSLGSAATDYSLDTATLSKDASITAKPLSVTAYAVDKVYGISLSNESGYTGFSSSGLVTGDSIDSVTVVYTDGADAADPVAVYPGAVEVSNAVGGVFTASNYEITYVSGDLTVVALSDSYFRSVAGVVDWNDVTSWEVSADGTNWYAAPATPFASEAGAVNIQTGSSVIVTEALSIDQTTVNGTLSVSGAELTVVNGSETDLTVNAGGTLSVDSESTLVIGGGSAVDNDGTFSSAGTVTFINGTNDGILYNSSSTISFGTLTAGSGEVVYDGSGAQVITSGDYFDLSATGGVKTLSGNISAGNDLSVGSDSELTLGTETVTVSGSTLIEGTLILGSRAVLDNNGTFSVVDGVLNNSGRIFAGGTVTIDIAEGESTSLGGRFIYDGAESQDVEDSIDYNQLYFSGGGNKTVTDDITVSSFLWVAPDATLNISSGTLTSEFYTYVSSGLTVAEGAVLDNNGTFTVAGGVLNNSGRIFAGGTVTINIAEGESTSLGGRFIYDGAESQDVEDSIDYNQLYFSGGGNKTVTDDITVSSYLWVAPDATLNISSGTLTSEFYTYVSSGLTVAEGAVLDNNGTFSVVGGVLNNSGRIFAGGTVTIDIAEGESTSLGGRFIYDGAESQDVEDSIDYNQLYFSGGGNKTVTDDITVSSYLWVAPDATLNISSGTLTSEFYTYVSSGLTVAEGAVLDNNGTFTVDGGVLNNSGRIFAGGTVTIDIAEGESTSLGGRFIYDGAESQDVEDSIDYNQLYFEGGGNKTVTDDITVSSYLWVAPDATLNISSGTLTSEFYTYVSSGLTVAEGAVLDNNGTFTVVRRGIE